MERFRRFASALAAAVTDPRGWWVSSALALLAAGLRLPGLGQPHAFSFDETYYAKDAFSLLRHGVERAFVDDANTRILAGDLDVFSGGAEFVVHPPLGKWAIAVGEAAFGMTPFGWRIVMALLGIGMVVLLHRATLRLSASPVIAALAGLFLAIDGMAIVLSRTALLDQTLAFLVVATYAALIRDRDHYAHTLALREYGVAPRRRHLRPWRWVAMVTITAAFATKWSALWFALVFALLALLWDARLRREHGVDRSPWLADLGWLAAASVVGVVGYLASWAGWLRSSDGWGREWSGGEPSWLPQGLRALVEYHRQALHFHVNLTSDHPYKAAPWTWPLQLRPTSFFYESYPAGSAGCPAGGGDCAAEVLALGNVVVWWTACATVLFLLLAGLAALGFRLRRRPLAMWVARIPGDAVLPPLLGVAAGWGPWLWLHERTTFTFYSVVFAPFLCALAAHGLALLATRRELHPIATTGEQPSESADALRHAAELALRSTSAPEPTFELHASADDAVQWQHVDTLHPQRAPLAILLVLFALAFTAFALPLWTGRVIAYDAWQMRMWLDSWV